MTAKEQTAQAVKLDYSDFANTYFAPRRFVAALDWENPSLAYIFMVNTALIGQFDLSGEELNSQYLIANIAMPYRSFFFKLGGCLNLIQNSGDSGIGFSGDLGAAWLMPGSFQNRLSLLARYTSGTNDSVDAFLPITTETQGHVLKAYHSGITMLSLDYAARLHPSCSISLSSNYFIRNDKETYTGFGDDGNLLGNEFYARLFWSPVSDMQFNFGGGVFLPSMGNVAPDVKAVWRVELNAIVSLY